MMSRRKKQILNTISSILFQCITVVCGIILPRYFLVYYGSEVNGLVTSISQFLGFISLAECGVGAVVESAFYQPLSDRDFWQISKIFRSSQLFFQKVAAAFAGYTLLLLVIYPPLVADSFDFLYTAGLILAISVSVYAEYCFGISYRLLLNADQLGFIQMTVSALALILKTVVSILIMAGGGTVQMVKLSASLILFIQPVIFKLCADRLYQLEKRPFYTEEPIRQKWDGLAQHAAAVVLNNTDTVVLTLFSTLGNVSVYHVYYFIASGIRNLVQSAMNGMQALFGSMLAKKEIDRLNQIFDTVEWAVHTLSTLLFTVTGILIVPFISVYTNDITDADYIRPVFAAFLVTGQAVRAIRIPYFMMIAAAGHFKETKKSAIMEATLNIVISILLVFRFDLVGVAAGTLLAMFYRTLYFVFYLKDHIVRRPLHSFFYNLLRDALVAVATIAVTEPIRLTENTCAAWFMMALQVGLITVGITVVVTLLSGRKELRRMIELIGF